MLTGQGEGKMDSGKLGINSSVNFSGKQGVNYSLNFSKWMKEQGLQEVTKKIKFMKIYKGKGIGEGREYLRPERI